MERRSQKIVLFIEEGFQNDTRNFESLEIRKVYVGDLVGDMI